MTDTTLGPCRLMLGDCLDRMSKIPDGSIDMTVTSPPYDNLRTYGDSLNDWNADKWQAILRELFRVTKEGGVVVWVVGDATINGSETGTSFRQALYAMECGFRLHDTMIYEKTGTGACGSNLSYWQTWEYMFTLSKGSPHSVNRIADVRNVRAGAVCTKGRIAANGVEKDRRARTIPRFSVRTNIWRFHAGNNGDDGAGHVAKFPEALARDHILSWSNPGDTVFDPFLGSGTTAKMALLHDRQCIGIERHPPYHAIACQRVRDAIAAKEQADRQGDLF